MKVGRYEVDEDATVWDLKGQRIGLEAPRLIASFEIREEAILWARLAAEHGPNRLPWNKRSRPAPVRKVRELP